MSDGHHQRRIVNRRAVIDVGITLVTQRRGALILLKVNGMLRDDRHASRLGVKVQQGIDF